MSAGAVPERATAARGLFCAKGTWKTAGWKEVLQSPLSFLTTRDYNCPCQRRPPPRARRTDTVQVDTAARDSARVDFVNGLLLSFLSVENTPEPQ